MEQYIRRQLHKDVMLVITIIPAMCLATCELQVTGNLVEVLGQCVHLPMLRIDKRPTPQMIGKASTTGLKIIGDAVRERKDAVKYLCANS